MLLILLSIVRTQRPHLHFGAVWVQGPHMSLGRCHRLNIKCLEYIQRTQKITISQWNHSRHTYTTNEDMQSIHILLPHLPFHDFAGVCRHQSSDGTDTRVATVLRWQQRLVRTSRFVLQLQHESLQGVLRRRSARHGCEPLPRSK